MAVPRYSISDWRLLSRIWIETSRGKSAPNGTESSFGAAELRLWVKSSPRETGSWPKEASVPQVMRTRTATRSTRLKLSLPISCSVAEVVAQAVLVGAAAQIWSLRHQAAVAMTTPIMADLLRTTTTSRSEPLLL